MKRKLFTFIGATILLLTSCNQRTANHTHNKQQRYVVKLVKRGEMYRLGADGLSDEDFDRYTAGQSLIPGDVIVITTSENLEVIKTMVEKKDLKGVYCAPVVKIPVPDGLIPSSKYSYEIMVKSQWDEYIAKDHLILNDFTFEYSLVYSKYEACVVNADSTITLVADLDVDTSFYCLFDSSCVSKKEFDFGLVKYYISPLAFLMYNNVELEQSAR